MDTDTLQYLADTIFLVRQHLRDLGTSRYRDTPENREEMAGLLGDCELELDWFLHPGISQYTGFEVGDTEPYNGFPPVRTISPEASAS